MHVGKQLTFHRFLMIHIYVVCNAPNNNNDNNHNAVATVP